MSTMFPVSALQESNYNARKSFTKESMGDLVDSIKAKGIQVPLIIRPIGELKRDGEGNRYEIVAGARRFRAAMILKLDQVPAILRRLTDEEAREVQIIENLQRADLHPMEEAKAYAALLTAKVTPSDVAVRVGKSESYIRQRLVLSNLVPELEKAFKENILSARVSFLCARQTPDQQKEIVKWFKREGREVTYSDVLDFVTREFHLDLSKAVFDTKSEELVPKAGACIDCPKRTGNNQMLFGDVKKSDTCTDAVCFREKERAFVKIQVGTHKDAVLLTVNHDYDEKPLGLEVWRSIGKKPCKNVKQGVVVQRSGHYPPSGKDFQLGAVLEVCVNPKCEQHFDNYSTSSRAPLTPAEKSKRMQHRHDWAVTQKVHFQMVQELRNDSDNASDEDVRRLVLEILADYGSRYRCVLLAPAFGQKAEGKTPSQKAANGRENLERYMRKASREDLIAFLFTYPLTPFGDGGKAKEMRDVAKRFGVNIVSIEKEAKKPKVKPPKASAKPKGKGGRKAA